MTSPTPEHFSRDLRDYRVAEFVGGKQTFPEMTADTCICGHAAAGHTERRPNTGGMSDNTKSGCTECLCRSPRPAGRTEGR